MVVAQGGHAGGRADWRAGRSNVQVGRTGLNLNVFVPCRRRRRGGGGGGGRSTERQPAHSQPSTVRFTTASYLAAAASSGAPERPDPFALPPPTLRVDEDTSGTELRSEPQTRAAGRDGNRRSRQYPPLFPNSGSLPEKSHHAVSFIVTTSSSLLACGIMFD